LLYERVMNTIVSLIETGDELLGAALGFAMRNKMSLVRWQISNKISRQVTPDDPGQPSEKRGGIRQPREGSLFLTPMAWAIYERLARAADLFNQAGETVTEQEIRVVMTDIDHEYKVLYFHGRGMDMSLDRGNSF
jgi:hypothetical protein